jgi:hypothetical protein
MIPVARSVPQARLIRFDWEMVVLYHQRRTDFQIQ